MTEKGPDPGTAQFAPHQKTSEPHCLCLALTQLLCVPPSPFLMQLSSHYVYILGRPTFFGVSCRRSENLAHLAHCCGQPPGKSRLYVEWLKYLQ